MSTEIEDASKPPGLPLTLISSGADHVLAGGSLEPLRVEVSFEATEDRRLAAIRYSAHDLVDRILSNRVGDEVWTLREVVWPALSLPEFHELPIGSVKLTLLPLSRIGQMEGKSGSLVLIGYLSSEGSRIPHSHPLVVKTLDSTRSDKLGDEYSSALSIKPFAYDRKDSFAIPIHFDETQEGYKLLWSICSISGDLWRGPTDPETRFPIFEGNDLRRPLVEGDVEQAERTLVSVFDLLRNCHSRFGMASREERSVGREYKRYLRGLGPDWGEQWVEMWGTDEQTVRGDPNPLCLVERLKRESYEMFVGAVHGDLHPGNVVPGRGGNPAIIDFGWASDKAHVAKDFVLMECNIRFLTLRLQVRPDEVGTFQEWITWGAVLPSGLSEYLQGRMRLIVRLREKAAEVFPKDTDWDREYLVPLFLVSVGLLRFGLQLGNQQAAIELVLSLARHLAARFPT